MLFAALVGSLAVSAQTVSDFESLTLPGTDTAYVNYATPGKDVGFTSGLAYFPCVYDTAFGMSFWSSGFAYSNKKDTLTSGYLNAYAAKTGKGFSGSAQYATANGSSNFIHLTGAAAGHSAMGFYITNSTYAYNSMRDGDAFAKKFSAADSDYFRLDVFAYSGGLRKADSVSFFLADFRDKDPKKGYIVKDWEWVDLLKLGKADSFLLRLTSSDEGAWGMNTPASYCIDHFITNETGMDIKEAAAKADFKVFPNPASNRIYLQSSLAAEQQVTLSDMSGRLLASISLKGTAELDITHLSSGTYVLIFSDGVAQVATKIQKQ